MTDNVGRIGLEETIAALRQELIASVIASQGEGLRFEVGEVIVEFNFEVERSADAKGGIKFWVVELGGSTGIKDKSIHKVTIPLKPVRRDGKPVLTGGDEVPM
jgi:Trypsin-co-occurring domain 2